MKVGRNDPCPCGSGKKFKVCCAERPRGMGRWVPFRWIANLYIYFLDSAENTVRRGNWNRRPGSYEGPFLGLCLPGLAAPFMAFVWTGAVVVLVIVAVMAAASALVRLLGGS